MVKWRKVWFQVLYVGMTLMSLVAASAAASSWD